ncbi:Uncharacterized protein DBV15_07176 [Temnothorax longispinosus]|uniref:Uncharacterized protein n=1 Tax=Temnothorax longispinosus TaxID=300112 RepID=A0A4S2KL38_9HYME|nr:Uncharacterized protein DBV15_07176 [Temnothorax longispinosus]
MSERARQKNPPILFLILSKEDTSTNAFPLRLGPTLPIGSFRQNEPLVFCHYPLEVVIFGSLRPPSSEVAASDFRAPRYSSHEFPSRKDVEIRITSTSKERERSRNRVRTVWRGTKKTR